MADKIRVRIDAALVDKMRAKAIADGLPDARTLPDEELLAALIQAEVGDDVDVVTQPTTVWVDSRFGLNLRAQPISGRVKSVLTDKAELTVLAQQDDWLRVRTADGLEGWVSASFVSDVDPFPSVPKKGNVRGIHGSAGVVAPPRHLWGAWISELKAMGMAWYKQMDAGDPNDVGGNSTFAWARELKRNGIEPIIRYYQGQMFPGRLHDLAFEKMQRYAAAGIVWCELGNEPNLDRAE